MDERAPVSAAAVRRFERDGAVLLREVFDPQWLAALARGVEKNFTAPGPQSTRYTPQGAPGAFYDDYCNWQRVEEYRDFVLRSPAGAVAGELMRSREARLYHEHVLVKEPGTREVTPWHHDLPYYGLDGTQLLSIWLPLDPVPRRACPEFVAGSHRWGKRFVPRMFVDHRDYGVLPDGFDRVPDIDAAREDYEILSWTLAPGDCIAFHMLTLHGAPGTATLKTRRRGFSTRWMGDDAVFATRPWATSPPFPGLGLKPGDAMRRPEFPLVWSRAA